MDIGIGLPTTLPGTTGDQAVEWASRADAAGFASLGTIDRLVYPNYEPLWRWRRPPRSPSARV